jgi:phage terminase large subunit-like protein
MNFALSQSDIAKLTPAQKAKAIEAIKAQLEDVERLREMEIAKNPFYMFEPPQGKLNEVQKAFLRKWLKPEDVPEVLDGQLESLVCDADIILTAGGNQSGKSTIGAIEDFIDITKKVPYPMQEYYPKEKIPEKIPFHVRTVGVDHTQMLNTVIPAYRQWVPREFLIKGRWEDSFSAEQRVLTLKKGNKVYGTVEFMTNAMDVEKFQGPPKDKANYDEEPRQDIYKENLLRFVTAKRLRIRFRMTPTKGMTWIKSEILDKEGEANSNIKCFKLPSVGNPKANLEVVEEILRKIDSYDERKMRLLGAFISLSGLVYGNLFNRQTHIIEPFPVDFDNYVVYRGGDPHLVKPTVFVELAVDREENAYVIGVYSANKDTAEIKAELADRVKTRGKDAKGWRLAQTRVDKSCNSTIKALGDRNIFLELSRGQNAIPAMVSSEKFVGSINAGVDLIKQALKDKKLFFFDTPEVWQLIKAFESLEREMATNEDKKGIRDVIAESRWDQHAALRYVYQGPIRWIPEGQSAPELEPERFI